MDFSSRWADVKERWSEAKDGDVVLGGQVRTIIHTKSCMTEHTKLISSVYRTVERKIDIFIIILS